MLSRIQYQIYKGNVSLKTQYNVNVHIYYAHSLYEHIHGHPSSLSTFDRLGPQILKLIKLPVTFKRLGPQILKLIKLP